MTREFFDNNVIMAVEIDGFMGKHWTEMKCSEIQDYLDRLDENEGLSDIDYCTKQEDPEIQKILDKATEIWMDSDQRKKFKSFDEAINSLLAPKKRVWTEDEIKNLIQTNDKVLYAAFKKLYECQTADEQMNGNTHHVNGIGFNGVDAPILSSMAEFLIKTGFLTPKQKAVVRKKLVKYNKQLTNLANA